MEAAVWPQTQPSSVVVYMYWICNKESSGAAEARQLTNELAVELLVVEGSRCHDE